MSLERNNFSDDEGSRLSDATSSEFLDLNRLRIVDSLYQSLLLRYVKQASMVHAEGGRKVVRAGGRKAGQSLSTVVVNVLDVGCANACALTLYQSIAFSLPARARVDYVGLDLDDVALARAREQRVQPRNSATIVKHDITTRWPVDDGWADIIWYTEALEHVPVEDAPFTLREAKRVLAPTGEMLLSTPAPRDGKMRWPDGHDHEFTREETAFMLLDAGWEVRDVWGIGNRFGIEARRVGGEVYDLYRKLLDRSGRALAGSVVGLLYPELADDLCWLCVKPNEA